MSSAALSVPTEEASEDVGGSTLQFGASYEDSHVELAAIAPHSRVFCICGSGCTALDLAAAGHTVTAVDSNSEQLEYARERASGAPQVDGMVERLLTRGRAVAGMLGWSTAEVRKFLQLTDTADQVSYWREILGNWRFQAAFHLLLPPTFLRQAYGIPFSDELPSDCLSLVKARLLRGWSTHVNRCNPYAWRLLMGGQDHPVRRVGRPVEFVVADAAEYLENCPPRHFHAFALSNLLDGAPPSYAARLHAAVKRAATPGAIEITRSFSEPDGACGSNWASRDRSLLWGVVDVRRLKH